MMEKFRYAPPDPTLPKPWRALVDSATSNLYFWNPETNVTTYVHPAADLQPSPAADPQPPHSDQDQTHQIRGAVDLDDCGDDINHGDPSHQSKRKDTSKFHTSEKTFSKKQKTSPSLVVDAAEAHVEESIMKPTEVSHLVEKEKQDSDEVHKAKETRKMSEVEGEVSQSVSTNEAKLIQANRSGTFEMNVISSVCTTLVAKETDNSLPEEMSIVGTNPYQELLSIADGPKDLVEMNVISSICTTHVAKETSNSLLEEIPIVGTDLNQELLSIADGPKGLCEETIDHDGLTDQDGGPIINNMSNDNVDSPVIDSTQIETNPEKQLINRSLAPPIDKVEEDLTLMESIDRLTGVTDQLFGAVEAMRYMIHYVVSVKETDVQGRHENEELKKKVADLKKKVADLEAKLKETMVGNQH